MDFPDDLKLSPVGAAPPLPSTPPVPPARTRPSRRLPQLPVLPPASQPESRASFRPTISKKPSIKISDAICAPKRHHGRRSPPGCREEIICNKPTDIAMTRSEMSRDLDDTSSGTISHHDALITREGSQFLMPSTSDKLRANKINRDLKFREGPHPNDILRNAKNPGHNASPPYGISNSTENPLFVVSSPRDCTPHVVSNSRESQLDSISTSRESPPYGLSRSKGSPPHSVSRPSSRDDPQHSISSTRKRPSYGISSSIEGPSHGLSKAKEYSQNSVSSAREDAPNELTNSGVSPAHCVSSPRVNPSHEESSGISPQNVMSNSGASLSNVSASLTPPQGVTSARTSPSHGQKSARASPDHGPSSDRASPAHGPSSDRASPAHGLTSARTSPPHGLTSTRASPPHGLTSARASPPHGLTNARTSPPHGLTSARRNPPNKISNSSDNSPRLSVKCLAENCEQISSCVSQLVISNMKSSQPATNHVSQMVISGIKSSLPAPNDASQLVISDIELSYVSQLVISDTRISEPMQAFEQIPTADLSKTAQKTTSPTKPVLKKADAIDIAGIEEKKKMERGISHATGNEPLVLAARNVVQQDFQVTAPGQTDQKDSPVGQPGFIETPLYTFTLPDLTNFPEDFRGFLEKDLIEVSALISLEQAGRLNWWADTGTCQRLWPLATTGDGNCLLHAASLGMWGFHDRLLTLRKALHTFLTSSGAVDAIYRRWRWQATQQNLQSGLSLTEAEWQEEWNSVLRLASTEPRTAPAPPKRRSRLSMVSLEGLDGTDYHQLMYESLEEVHVLVLAHVLRRPIIIVADTILKDAYGEALAPIPFGGIYLPLEVSPSECHKCPLLLTYDAGHFSALVGMQSAANVRSPLPTVIPLTDSNHSLVPIQFCVDPGDQLTWGQDENIPHVVSKLTLQHQDQIGLLKEFLDVLQVPLPVCFLDPPPDSEPHSPDSPDPCTACTYEAEISSRSSDESSVQANKSKTAKQIQSVAKQFGSIGKTVSKKLKKNLGTITKLARSGSFKGLRRDVRAVSQTTRLQTTKIVAGHQDYILTAIIHTNKCLPYHQEMVTNYLEEAKIRFDKDKEMKVLQADERRRREEERLEQMALAEGPVQCINPDCQMMGSAVTSYLCSYCYYHQIRHETDTVDAHHHHTVHTLHTDALYGSGKSKFYVNADESSYETLRNIPVAKHATLRNNDSSIYLANSTFYRDNVPLVVPVSLNDPDPPPIVAVDPPQPRNLSRKKWLSSNSVINGDATPPIGVAVTTNRPMRVGTELNGVDGDDVCDSCSTMKVQLPKMIDGRPCQTSGCSFFGTSETDYFCSKCFKESQRYLLTNQASQV